MWEKTTVFLATNRRDLDRIAILDQLTVWCRTRDTLNSEPLLANCQFGVMRGPITLDVEINVLDPQKLDQIFTRNSREAEGRRMSKATGALGLHAAMICRPPQVALLRINGMAEALNWVRRRK